MFWLSYQCFLTAYQWLVHIDCRLINPFEMFEMSSYTYSRIYRDFSHFWSTFIIHHESYVEKINCYCPLNNTLKLLKVFNCITDVLFVESNLLSKYMDHWDSSFCYLDFVFKTVVFEIDEVPNFVQTEIHFQILTSILLKLINYYHLLIL